MNKGTFIGLLIAGLILAGLAWWIMTISQSNNTAYVQLGQVYEEFELKKELEAELLKVTNARNAILDSLRLNIQLIPANQQNSPDARQKMQVYMNRQQEFEQSNQSLSEKYDQQIWNQLNQYVKDYGEANNYQYIYGVSGTGNVMYANEENDVTDAIIDYLNNKYGGTE